MDLMAWSYLAIAAIAFFMGRWVFPRERKRSRPVVVADIRDTF